MSNEVTQNFNGLIHVINLTKNVNGIWSNELKYKHWVEYKLIRVNLLNILI